MSSSAAQWRPNGHDGESDEPSRQYHGPRRTLLFHIASMMDVNECALDFIDVESTEKTKYFKLLYHSVAREVCELQTDQISHLDRLSTIFSLFHENMLRELEQKGRREPGEALRFWKRQNEGSVMISPMPFNLLARSCLSCQASSALAERVFSDVGRMEGNQSQSLMSSSLEIIELVKSYTKAQLKVIKLPQNSTLHPDAVAFKRVVDAICEQIVKNSFDEVNDTSSPMPNKES